MPAPMPGEKRRLERADFPAFLAALGKAGYRVVGPTVRDGAIVYGEIGAVEDLPVGWTEQQEAGRYRLERRHDDALFGYVVGPHSWKKYLFPAHEKLWTARRTDGGFEVAPTEPDPTPLAFLGVRACEIAAIGIQDKVFLGGVADPGYRRRWEQALTIAVQCGQSGGTCFCVSMGTGPAVRAGYDLSLTEILAPGSIGSWWRSGPPRAPRSWTGCPRPRRRPGTGRPPRGSWRGPRRRWAGPWSPWGSGS